MNRPIFFFYLAACLGLGTAAALANPTSSDVNTYYPSPVGDYDKLSSRNVGIGFPSTSVDSPLEIHYDAGNAGWLKLGNGGLALYGGNAAGNIHIDSTSALYLNYYAGAATYFGSANGTTIAGAWLANGNVAIGNNAAPGYPLIITTPGTDSAGKKIKLMVSGDDEAGGGMAVSGDGGFYDWNDGRITYEPGPSAGGNGLKAHSYVRTIDDNSGFIDLYALDGALEMASGNDGYSYIDFKGSANLGTDYQGRILYTDSGSYGASTGAMLFYTAATGSDQLPPLLLDLNGNVGVGTSLAGAKLTVLGAGGGSVDVKVNGRMQTGDGTNWGGVWLDGASTQFMGEIHGTVLSTLGLYNNGIWALSIPSSGMVGINDTTPSYQLDVNGAGGGNIDLNVTGTGRIASGLNTAGGGTGGFQVGPGQIFGSRDANTVGLLNSGVWGLYFDNAGNATVANNIFAAAYFYASDQRLKQDIHPLTGAREKLLRLKGVDFKWKSTGARDVGLIAQDVEKVFPQLVATDEKGMKRVEYSHLNAVLIEVIKEHQKEIEILKQEIALLSGRV